MGCHFSVQVKPWSPQHKKGKVLPGTPTVVNKKFSGIRHSLATIPMLHNPVLPHRAKRRGVVADCQPRPPPTKKRLALVVGINAYDHWPSLDCATHDATKIAAMLEALQFETRLLLNHDATRNNLFREMEQCMYQSSTFVVALFGHGIEMNGSAMFVPVDAKADGETDKIHTDFIRGLSKRSQAASGLFVFDCCFSGTFLCEKRSRSKSWAGALTQEKSRIVITSGLAGETVEDADGAGQHSPFTMSLVHALEHCDAPMSSIQLYVILRSYAISKYHGLVIPKLGRFAGDEGGDTFLADDGEKNI